MRTFIVKDKKSDIFATYLVENPPIEGAYKGFIHQYDHRYADIKDTVNWESWKNTRRDLYEYESRKKKYIRGTIIEPQEVWLIDIEDVMTLVEKYGRIIIESPYVCEENYPLIKIG